jgi:hypothetical protein
MVKRVNIDNILFLDFDKITYMYIEEFGNVIKTDHGSMVKTAFKVIAVSDSGMKFPVFTETESGKADSCMNWITKNWLK